MPKPVYLADIQSLAYSVLLCHYIYREGLTDEEVNIRLTENGIKPLVLSLAGVCRWRRALARDGCLEALDQGTDHRLIRWRLSARGKQIIEEDLARLLGLETPPAPVPAKEKIDGAITNLKSFLHKTRAFDPF